MAKKYDVAPDGSGKWTASAWTSPVNGHQLYDSSGVLSGDRLESYDPTSGSKLAQVTATFWPSSSDSTIINHYGGQLPTPLEVVELKYSARDSSNQERWFERYYYARKNISGTYNYFGLIKWDHAVLDSNVCVNGTPTSGHSNATCYGSLYIDKEDSYANFYSDSVPTWYTTVLNNKPVNDPKFTKRTATDSYGNIEEHNHKPRNRGGFLPQGAGNDSTNTGFTTSDMIFLETTGLDQDWYVYRSGQDPLYPSGSPTNYCRDGYNFVGSFVTNRSYNLLQYGNGTIGDWASSASGSIGTYYPSSSGNSAHWLVLCGTAGSDAPKVYVNASNANEASCASGYSTRLWFGANYSGVTACPPGQSCFDGSSKGYINFCVKSSECVGNCMGTTNP